MDNQDNSKQDCGCGDECCTPKGKKGNMWTKIIFGVIIIAAGTIITVKLAAQQKTPSSCCPQPQQNTLPEKSVSSCCPQPQKAPPPSCCPQTKQNAAATRISTVEQVDSLLKIGAINPNQANELKAMILEFNTQVEKLKTTLNTNSGNE